MVSEEERIEVRIGDPHNDQIAAASNEQLNSLIESTNVFRAQAREQGRNDETAMMAIIATSIANAGWSEIKVASLLAAALLRMTKPIEEKEDVPLDFGEDIQDQA